ncbi:hypothetical protein GCM10009127_07420 [Alteraurantiacibacter aestuarii]|uniref:Gene transfer agent family protein n=1 Tax=Alteraurantiacibacter aestuarii TaxID=650004 RepID=A0A844ZH04_9SPHN|nr:gene transfer agent family protein [Alteraurantiacibacter aestuarii]MXO87135.1 gene transfer agent family protein [Alteraurantiacibacter aestuarii]
MTAGGPTPNAQPNSQRGEASIIIGGRSHILRPTFAALVAAEEQLGPLFALVERAGEGRLALQEIATLFWHCCQDRGDISQVQMGDAVMETGLAACSTPLRSLLQQILQGSA